MYIMKILKFISFTILISVFSFLTINSANALPPCSIEPTGLNCLSEKYSKNPSTELCNKIIQTYNKGAFKCCGRKEVAPPPKKIDETKLDQLVNDVTFKGWTPTKLKAVTFPGETYAVSKPTEVMLIDVRNTNFFRTEIQRRYDAFVKTYHCTPETENIQCKNLKPTVSTKYRNLTRNAFLKKQNERHKKGHYSYRTSSSYPFCSNFFYEQCGRRRTIPSKPYTCPPLILDNHYDDNQYEFKKDIKTATEGDILNLTDEKNEPSIQCIKKYSDKKYADVLEVAKIKIESSASTLNNGGEFCKKDFIGLSMKRAETARDAIIASFRIRRPTMINDKTTFELDYSGRNDDGTSGPCAYYLNNDGLMGNKSAGIDRKILDPNKYVRITITFKNKKPATAKASEWEPKQCSVVQMCREIYFNCPKSNVRDVPSGTFAIKK